MGQTTIRRLFAIQHLTWRNLCGLAGGLQCLVYLRGDELPQPDKAYLDLFNAPHPSIPQAWRHALAQEGHPLIEAWRGVEAKE